MKLYYREGEAINGPISLDEFNELYASGIISESTMVRSEDSEEWVELQTLAIHDESGAETELMEEPQHAAQQSAEPAATPEAAPVQTGEYSFRPIIGIAKKLRFLFYACIGISVIAVISDCMENNILTALQQGRMVSGDIMEAAEASDARQAFIGLVQLGFWITSVVFFAIWTYRCNVNVRAMGAKGLRNSPAWAVGWYFIPIANLWKPYQAMKEIWKASVDPAGWETQPRPLFMLWWWLVWILNGIVDRLAFRIAYGAESVDSLIYANAFTTISDILSVPLTLLALKLVSDLTKMQARWERN